MFPSTRFCSPSLRIIVGISVALLCPHAQLEQDRLPQVPLQPWQVSNYYTLRGQETTVTAQPFYVLPQKMRTTIIDEAQRAVEELIFDDHNDEADWQPAFEVYVMERSVPLPGVAPLPLIGAVNDLAELTLPFVREAYSCSDCVPCTAFVRRYLPSERMHIPAHFDVTAFATIILPLTAADNYTGGFFIQPGAHVDTRQFVHLEVGDVAIHDFTLNHGIEVREGGRFSLVIWVSQHAAACQSSSTPWHADRALAGDAVAQHILGMMYGQGNGAPKDDQKAFLWTLRAAETGLANAQFSAGTMYFEGQGTPTNETLAHHWYKQAAIQGDASSQIILARMYMEGIGADTDDGLARYWYQLGSSQRGAHIMGPPRWSR